jgi:hypothetical protein
VFLGGVENKEGGEVGFKGALGVECMELWGLGAELVVGGFEPNEARSRDCSDKSAVTGSMEKGI